MDFLQVALIILIVLLAVFLSLTGIQVFLILKDLKKALDRFNKILEAGEGVMHGVERPVSAAMDLVTSLTNGANVLRGNTSKKTSKSSSKRFFKRL